MTAAEAGTISPGGLTGRRGPELLAPAGDWDAARAAVANGADAIYFGLDQFNARHRATNFTLEALPGLMEYLHGHNVKGFLTFNTLIFSDELEAAAAYVEKVAAAGVDAVIVQDLGLAGLVHRMAPGLHIHGSTQMTLTEPRGIEFVRSLGVGRVVLARELSVGEIRKIRERTTTELEVFVHGALCVAYSGQCLTSESIGGRSANRGQCAQACRLPYQLVVDGKVKDLGDKAYLLSPQDLAAHELVGELAAMGVSCFKIEGRLKSAHYVAATTQTYRAAIDAASAGEAFAISARQKGDLQQSFSRGFTQGFLGGVNHQELVGARFPKSRGVRAGTVVSKTARGVVVRLENADADLLKPGDGVVFDEGRPEQDEQGGRVFAVRATGGGRVEVTLGQGDVNLAAVAVGAIVWKTDDPAMKRRLEQSFARDRVARRTAVDFAVRAEVGKALEVAATAGGHFATVVAEQMLEAAQKFPVTEAAVREQLDRLGDTPFELGRVTLTAVGGPMVPKSLLNDLRRRAVEKLMVAGRDAVRVRVHPERLAEMRAFIKRAAVPAASTPSLYVAARTLEQLRAVAAWRSEDGLPRPAMVYCDFEDVRRYVDAVAVARAASLPIALGTTRVVKPGEEGLLRQVAKCGPDALLVRNLAAISLYHDEFPAVPLIGDYSLNVANELTAQLFADHRLVRMVPSYDLNWKQLSAMVGRFGAGRFETVIHQHMPMFHMEHCVFCHTLSTGTDYRTCGRPCDTHKVELRDREGQPHPLVADVGCRNTVFNAAAQSAADYLPEMSGLGLAHFRVELLREDEVRTRQLLGQYSRLVHGLDDAKAGRRSLNVIRQLGVTRGTLDWG